jgi:DNA-binding MarR family transcriptional regulator
MDRFDTPELVARETGHVIEQEAYLHLIRTAEVLSGPLSDLLARFGLSGKQYNVLRAIRRGGADGETVSRIGEQMTDPRADMTRLLDRLERDGLTERRHDRQDRRVVRVVLTEQGRARLAEMDEPLVALHRAQFAHMSPQALQELVALLALARSGGAATTSAPVS